LSTDARAVLVFFTVLGAPATARAFDKASCVDSHASAQTSMKAGQLRESKHHLLICADSSCPSLVRQDCEKWLSNLDRQLQPVTIEARDATGKVLMAVRVPLEVQAERGIKAGTETGSGPASEPSPAAVPPDRATCDGRQCDHGSAADGAERRSEDPPGHGSPAAEKAPTPPIPVAPPADAQQGHDGPSPRDDSVRVRAAEPRQALPTIAWVTGVLALASFGTAAVVGVTGWSEARSLRETCAPNCQSSRVSAVRRDLLIADLAGLTGVAFSAATAWIVWAHREAGAHEGPKPVAAGLSASITGSSFRLDYAASF